MVLEEFWYGNIMPQEQCAIHNPEIDNLLLLTDKNLKKLSETLTDAQRELLQKYDDCISEMKSINERELFIYAFRLGGRFMAEILLHKER